MNTAKRAQTTARYALFDSVIGRCGIAWNERGVTRVGLPEASLASTVARVGAGGAVNTTEPPAPMRRIMKRLTQHLAGELQDLDDLPLDFEGLQPFAARVYRAARKVSAGRTVTYGELAARIGAPGAARALGRALGANPFPIVVPCHRVLAANGRLGGFSAHGGVDTKVRLLEIEGAMARQTPLHLAGKGW
ncbi:MAG TPA: methylated-DNA--[protein]-cysteine S-methyltransferase [Polyangiaceae bacterium]|nr:methylated-DNA--[protein]-cysteine S-methyltransferase [Polyangiaceae bacterium]